LSGSTRKKRNLLSHQATISQEYEKKHQVEVWTQHLRYFGLKEKIILSPLISPSMQHNNDKVICLAPGSSNTPEKRWPIENWINLLTSLNDKLPGYKYKLTGSKKDTEICNTITKEFPGKNIANLSGETNLTDLCNLMRRSNLLICNDSGAMHLANSIGVSVVALFGVTSHNLTGPVFETNKRIVNLRGKSNPKDVGIVTRAVLKVL
jgi:heptosyltransferase-2